MIHAVILARSAQKNLATVPAHVAGKLLAWTALVREHGLEEVRKIPGYHDEPLHGKRKGQR